MPRLLVTHRAFTLKLPFAEKLLHAIFGRSKCLTVSRGRAVDTGGPAPLALVTRAQIAFALEANHSPLI